MNIDIPLGTLFISFYEVYFRFIYNAFYPHHNIESGTPLTVGVVKIIAPIYF